jgi:two-component system chemotaxis response regulator CheY
MMNIEDCFENRHFLVVDDEPFIRTVVARFLKGSGAANVVEAADGGAAIAALADYPLAFDAVITDISMGPVNGIELLRAIRVGQDGLKRNTPVLMLTVHSEADLVAEALALGTDAFVLKPIHREDLIDRVSHVLERAASGAPIAH